MIWVSRCSTGGDDSEDGGRCNACQVAGRQLPSARWWSLRRAQNRKPATYRCPICHQLLPSLSEHILMAPEGDTTRRRHAHTHCVTAARARGQLPTREEWLATQPRRPGLLSRVLARLGARG